MKKIILIGWNIGFDKIGLTKLLQNELGYSLSKAKDSTDSLLNGQELILQFTDTQYERVVIHLSAIGVKFVTDEQD